MQLKIVIIFVSKKMSKIVEKTVDKKFTKRYYIKAVAKRRQKYLENRTDSKKRELNAI